MKKGTEMSLLTVEEGLLTVSENPWMLIDELRETRPIENLSPRGGGGD